MTDDERMRRIDRQVSHVWMVRTFVKHSEEAEDDPELYAIPRGLYDFCLALGSAWEAGDAARYLTMAKKKLSKLRQTSEAFAEMQPEVSAHTNFEMAVRSLRTAVEEITRLVDDRGDDAAE